MKIPFLIKNLWLICTFILTGNIYIFFFNFLIISKVVIFTLSLLSSLVFLTQIFLLAGSFSNDGINEFLRDLSYGKGRTSPVKGAQIPKIDTIEAWDGKDGELPVEEEYDLSDVELDDLEKDELWLWKPELF